MAISGRFFVPFSPEAETISSYLERINLFMAASGTADDKKVAVLLSSVGLAAYTVLRDLCRPELPETQTLAALTELLEKHYKAKPLVIAERFYFGQRNQKEGESIAEYVAELRRLSAYCEYEEFLPQAIRDRNS